MFKINCKIAISPNPEKTEQYEVSTSYNAYQKRYYESHKKERKEYYEKNKEKIKEYQKKYYLDNKEKATEYRKLYREAKGEELRRKEREYSKKKYANNRETILAYNKKYAEEHKEELAIKRSEYRKTKKGRAAYLANSYVQADRNRCFETTENITKHWILENIFNGQKCFYCGESDWRKLGADRIDNTKGHTPDNCICSCLKCNAERGNKMSPDEFKIVKQENKKKDDGTSKIIKMIKKHFSNNLDRKISTEEATEIYNTIEKTLQPHSNNF